MAKLLISWFEMLYWQNSKKLAQVKSIHLNYFEMPVTKIYEREKTFKKSALKESRFRFFFRLLDSSVNAAKKTNLFPYTRWIKLQICWGFSEKKLILMKIFKIFRKHIVKKNKSCILGQVERGRLFAVMYFCLMITS